MAKQQMGFTLGNGGTTQLSDEQATDVASHTSWSKGDGATSACSHLPLGKGQDAMQREVRDTWSEQMKQETAHMNNQDKAVGSAAL